MNQFGERLKMLRKQSNVSQKELSMLIGVTERALRFYESGDREPNIDQLIQLAQFFDCSIDYLVGLTDNPKRC